MSTDEIIRAWRSEDYLLSLPSPQRQALPANPAGAVELLDRDIDSIEACTHACTGCASCWSGGSLCCC